MNNFADRAFTNTTAKKQLDTATTRLYFIHENFGRGLYIEILLAIGNIFIL